MKKVVIGALLLTSIVSVAASAQRNQANRIMPIMAMLLADDQEDQNIELDVNRARIIGPLANAQVTQLKIGLDGDSAETNVGSTSGVNRNINLSGNFDFNPVENGSQGNELFLVSATGGQDIDSDANGIADPSPTTNQGKIRVIASAIDLAEGRVTISPLSEIAVEYTEAYLGLVDTDIKQRLAQIAQVFFLTDITGDNVIDFQDISQFDPANRAHLNSLSFGYDQWLSVTDSGFRLIDTLINGDELAESAVINDLFGHALVLSTDITSLPENFQSIFITASIFGRGTLENSDLSISINNQTGEITDENRSSTAQSLRNSFAQTTFTAQAADGSRIVSWTGCDEISSNLTQCTISTSASRSITVNIAQDAVVMVDDVNLIDLSNARVTVTPTQLTVVTNDSLTELNQKLSAARENDFVVNDDGKGLLRKIVSIVNTRTNEYQIETIEAVLTDLIESGTGFLTKQLNNGDLAASTTNAPISGVTVVAKSAEDKVFSMLLGEAPETQKTPTAQQLTSATSAPLTASAVGAPLTLFDNGTAKLTVEGQLDIELDFEFGVDFERRRVSQFHYLTSISSTQTLIVEATGEIELIDPNRQYPIRTLSFKPVVFLIGFVPVWLTPEVEIYVTATGEVEANITYTAQATQSVQGGMQYLRTADRGVFRPINSSDIGVTSEFNRADVSGFVNPVVHAETTVELYGATGPVLDVALGARLDASLDFTQTLNQGCTPGYEVGLLATLSGDFFWSLSGDSRLGRLLDLERIEDATRFNIFTFDREIASWTGGSTCPPEIPFIDVTAPPLHFTGVANEVDNRVFRTIIIDYPDQQANQPVNWRMRSETGLVKFASDITNITDGSSEITGEISTGEQIARAFFIENLNELEPGIYRDTLFIENLNANDAVLPFASSQAGNAEVDIRVEIMPQGIAVPVITLATSNAPGTVSLNWTLDVSNERHSYTGYEIVKILDSDNNAPTTLFDDTEQVININDINTNHISLNEEPGTTVNYAIRAYTALDTGDFSTITTVNVQGQPLPPIVSPPTPIMLNDTGITFGGDFPEGNNTDCTGETIAQQDCSSGRDAQATAGTLTKVGAGAAGFDFTKLAADGSVLAIQDAAYSATGSEAAGTLWSCVRDNVTGLIWEVKTDDENSEHYRNNTYRWGGLTAVGRDHPDRQGDYFDDWNSLVNSANAGAGLCGFTDWRVPTPRTLQSIVHYGAFRPAIDTDFFPNTSLSAYWSSSPIANNSHVAWVVGFNLGIGGFNTRSSRNVVRLVRGGQ